VVAPAVLHVLTPGSPVYAVAKIGAVGSLFALRFVMTKRKKADEAAESTESPAVTPAQERRRSPHPVSRKKKQRRRR
jgi:hypothetical protein